MKLQMPSERIEGHKDVSTFLENSVRDLLENPVALNNTAQEALLDELEVIFKKEGNAEFSKAPSRGEVWRVISTAN